MEKIKAHQGRKRRKQDLWFARDIMYKRLRAHSASYGGARNVDDLTDTHFELLLQDVHKYLSDRSSERKALELVPNTGPVDASERYTSKAHVVGNLRRFKYYHPAVFQKEIETLDATATMATASEDVF